MVSAAVTMEIEKEGGAAIFIGQPSRRPVVPRSKTAGVVLCPRQWANFSADLHICPACGRTQPD